MAHRNRESAADRGAWPVRKFRLGAEPSDDLSESTTVEQRLDMVRSLTLEAWSLAGMPLPTYPREGTPIRLLRRPIL